MNRRQPIYDKQFRRMAAELALTSTNRAAVARELGLDYGALRGWCDTYKREQSVKEKEEVPIKLQEQLKDSHKRIAQLEEEVEILKKAAAYFAKDAL